MSSSQPCCAGTDACQALMQELGARARLASRALARSPEHLRNLALIAMAEGLVAQAEAIAQANAEDVQKARASGLAEAFVDRLTVSEKTLSTMAQGCRDIAGLPDPIGEISDMRVLPNGMSVGRMRAPLGVLGMIYEARPNVTIDAAALAIKSGNAAILRGGSEAFATNRILGEIVRQALLKAQLPADAVIVAPSTDRAFVGAMITARGLIDVIIPRGGKSLIARLERECQIPMIHHLDGICTTYVDADAPLQLALSIVDNAKTQRYSPCNATENLLVHVDAAAGFLPAIAAIFAQKGVQMRCCPRALAIITAAGFAAQSAQPEDWDTEYNAPIIAIAVVDSLQEAIDFIAVHGSGHTDAIVTESYANAQRFLREVDSGSVMVNCSTRLADGFEYGLGAEIGISTGKLHARGPVGLQGLTNQKYIVLGNGQLRH